MTQLMCRDVIVQPSVELQGQWQAPDNLQLALACLAAPLQVHMHSCFLFFSCFFRLCKSSMNCGSLLPWVFTINVFSTIARCNAVGWKKYPICFLCCSKLTIRDIVSVLYCRVCPFLWMDRCGCAAWQLLCVCVSLWIVLCSSYLAVEPGTLLSFFFCLTWWLLSLCAAAVLWH